VQFKQQRQAKAAWHHKFKSGGYK